MFLNNFVRLRFTGDNIRRFLNLCVQNNIDISNVMYINDTNYDASIRLKDLLRTTQYIRKTNIKIKIIKKPYLYVILTGYRNRYTFICSLAFIFIMTFSLCTRIWKIDVNGNDILSRDQILKEIQSKNIFYGSCISKIDCENLENEIKKDISLISWISIDVSGTQLKISLREKKYNNDFLYSSEKKRICSSKDAVISYIVTRNGIPKVKKGEKVKAGQLLVDDKCEILDDNNNVKEYISRNADADIWGYTEYNISYSVPKKQSVKTFTGKKKSFYYFSFDKLSVIPFFLIPNYEEYGCMDKSKQFKLFEDYYFPFYLHERLYYEQEIKQVEYSKKQAEEIINQNIMFYEEQLESNNIIIISEKGAIKELPDKFEYKGIIKACENIGVKK